MKQKIYKLLSIMLTLAMVLSACVCAIGTASAAETATYYVSSAGDDTAAGTADTTPLKTVDKAIQLANAAGLGAGDTVYVKLIHVADTSVFWAGDGTSTATLTSHAFTLDISSASTKASVGNGVSANLGGPTKFSNVAISCNNNGNFYFNGHDVHFGAGTSLPSTAFNFFNKGTVADDFNLYLGGDFSHQIKLAGNWARCQYKGDVNITANSSTAQSVWLGAHLGNNNSGSHAAWFFGNVNIDLQAVPSFTMSTGNKQRTIFAEGSGFQLINSAGADVSTIATTMSNMKYRADAAGTVLEAETTAVPYYIVNNNSGVAKAVSFSDTYGVYNVNLSSAWTVTVKDSAGEPVDAEVVEGKLDLTDLAYGVYTIDAEKTTAEELTLYVAPNGDDANDGKTADTPVATVNQAIALAKDAGLTYDDMLIVKLIKGDTANAWGVGTNGIAGHNFILKVMSNGDKADIGTGGLTLGGATIFENVTLNIGKNDYPAFTTNGYDVTFNEGASYNNAMFDFVITGGYGTQINKDVNIVYNTAFKRFMFGVWGMPYFNGDLNFTINHSGESEIHLGASQRTANQINKLVNFNIIQGALKLTIGTNVYGEAAAIQVINDNNSDVSSAVTALKTLNTNSAVPYYVLNNKTGIPGVLAKTAEEGVFAADFDETRFALLVDGEEAVIDPDGNVTIEPGEHDITLEVINPFNDTYYVEADAEGGDGQEATPFATVAEAIAAANAKGSVRGDNITIKVKGEAQVLWGESEAFSFIPVIESADLDAKTPLCVDAVINGEVIIDNVTLTGAGNEPYVRVNGNNITIGAGVNGNAYIIASNQDTTNNNAQTITINGNIGKIHAANFNRGAIVYKEDVNYIINNAEYAATFDFYPAWGANLTYNKNLNITVEAAASLKFTETEKAKDGDHQAFKATAAGVQLIIPADLTVTGIENFTAIAPDANYIIRNKGEFDIAYTEFAGEFAIDFDSEVEKLVVYDADGEVVDVELVEGILALPAVGEYTLVKECITHDYADDCDDTCDRCQEVDPARGHTFDFACSEGCSVCGTANEDAEEHTWTNCVDTECDVCGETRVAGEHVWDNACDADCNACGTTRTPADHVYDNDCDADCNVCGATRTPADHVYDNDCDADCNVCGGTRTPADHVYDGPADTDCNVCGDVRTIADGFIKEDGVYYYYEDGVKSTATTLVKVNGSWFYLENGAWTKKTALVKYSGSYFYVINGKWNSKTNDLIKYNGSWFYVKNGKWNKTTDLIKKDGVYFFVKNGKWSTAITTLFKKNGKFFSIKSGKWSKTTQIITYSGKKFYCKSGFAQLGFTGKAKVGSKTYNIVKGQVK